MQYKIQVNDLAQGTGYLQGLASVTFDNAIKIGGIKIGLGKNDSLFIGMPNYKAKEQKDGKDEYRDIGFPVTKEFRDELYRRILDTFDSLHDGHGNSVIYNSDSKERINPTVRVTPIADSENKVRALATVILNDNFALNNIAIKESREGKLFVAYPSYRTNKFTEDNKPVYQDVFYPVTKEWRKKLDGMIKEAYQKAMDIDKSKDEPEQKKQNKRSGKTRTA